MKTKMKCYIRRYIKEKQEWGNGYLVAHYDFMNHWTQDKQCAMKFDSCKEARDYIKENKIKNCNVEQELKHKFRLTKCTY